MMNKREAQKALLFTLAITTIAIAETVHVEFTGIINKVEEGTFLDGHVQLGDSFSGYYTYTLDLPDKETRENSWSQYTFPIPEFSYEVIIGNVTLSAIENYSILMDNSFLLRSDGYVVSSTNTLVSIGDESEYWERMDLVLKDPTATALDSSDLSEQIVLNEWFFKNLFLAPNLQGPFIKGEITSFEYVPEPSSLAILLLSGVAVFRRR